MNKIKAYLDQASIAYYSGTPIISDEVFDQLAQTIGYTKVGAKQHEHLKHHYMRMYSLQKYYEDEGVKPLAGVKDITTSPKLDGAAISLLYIDGKLVQALTRGDGIEGTDITVKVLAHNFVPHTIDDEGIYGGDNVVLQITGEVVAPKTVPNSRNYAAGSLNLKDIEEFKTRAISFFAYGVYPPLRDTFTDDMKVLSDLGFGTVYDSGLMDIYPCDGLVFRANSHAVFRDMGFTANHPRGAYAKKERAEAVETKILAVEWQVGKSGKVTPVAILEPIMIGDALISRATLNNKAFIEMLDICIGDTVGVIRSGDVIPCITHKVDA